MAADPQEVTRGYARALLSVAQAEGVLDRVEDELYRAARTVEGNAQLRERLTAPAGDAGHKLALVEELFGGKAHPQTVSALAYLVQAGRGRQLVEIADEFARQAAESRRQVLAEVRTAVALEPEQEERLAAALSKASGREIDLKVIVDPDVLGGVVAKLGDTVIDGSLARRLGQLRARLTGA